MIILYEFNEEKDRFDINLDEWLQDLFDHHKLEEQKRIYCDQCKKQFPPSRCKDQLGRDRNNPDRK